ncbi:hypothetical protein FO519_008806 [Halicephalobus sp. NKZ332]|nr:hypothetical protein FO519_008806 [Halicephalobus sp. NKZ332]
MGNVKLILHDFADWTSAAGIPQIAYALNKIIRILWIIIWCILLVVAFYQAYVILKKFLSYPMIVTTSLDYGPQDFPVITFCNNNPFIYSKVQENNVTFASIIKLMDQYTEMVSTNYSNISPDTYGLNNVTTRYEKTEWANEALVLLTAQLTETVKETASYQYSDVIKVCSFNGVECTEDNFTSYYDATYGKCFQFNTENSDYKTLRAGNAFGLTVLMLISQKDPQGNQLFLPTTTVAGARIGINLKGEDPAMEAFGINTAVGRETLIGIEFTKISRLKPPYSNCIDSSDETKAYYPNNTYTLDSCFRACIQKNIFKMIGCADPRYGKPVTFSYCPTTMLSYLRGLRDHQNPNYTFYFDPLAQCNCKPPCQETDIDTTVTMSRFPTDGYIVLNSKSSSQAYSCADSTVFTDQQTCIKWYSENSVVVDIFYDGLDYESYTEVASYPFSTMTNELGGQLSLWLGISIISFIEFIGLIIVLCMFCIYGRKVQIGPTEEDMENDKRLRHVKDLRDELDAHEHLEMQLRKRANMRQNDGGANPAVID